MCQLTLRSREASVNSAKPLLENLVNEEQRRKRMKIFDLQRRRKAKKDRRTIFDLRRRKAKKEKEEKFRRRKVFLRRKSKRRLPNIFQSLTMQNFKSPFPSKPIVLLSKEGCTQYLQLDLKS